ncbi:MAG: long-chain fatty acid--CoA ligase [Rhodocyclaceae bacterium]|nr:long-chain fatty acid--CoA ligase [Rhodocyclaceae bacterium]MBK9310099.1 long-chain fatty acid--CoA ligase [Rhodocyclaceae bacterium]MBK9954827.1 long-chain fatty acid--CoA ligase [Rhodocyclaceae bacterium]
MTLDDIPRRNALRFPDKTALAMGGRRLTWAELDDRVNRVAAALVAAGLHAGDRVAILLANCPEYIELYFGAARAGVIAVPVNYRLTAREMAQILDHAEPALLVAGSAYLGSAAEVRALLPALQRCWSVGASATGCADYEAMLARVHGHPFVTAGQDADTFAIFFTSGTTGLPKGAMVSHRNLIANGFNQFVADGSRRHDVNLIATPIYHMGAVFMGVTYMMLGCTQVILEQFDAAAWMNAVAAERVSVALLVPTMINAVVNHPDIASADLGSLRLLFYGGGPMPPAVLTKALERLPCGYTQGYGLTETLEATFLVGEDHVLDGTPEQTRRLASAGREAVDAEVRIVDDQGHDLPPGQVGEILIRGPSVISGYWRQAAETQAAIRDGWFVTGDLGYLDQKRYLFLVDRKKDMVVSGGVNIYTKEVEAALFEHPAVLEAAVIGLPDDEWGEIVVAAVVRRPAMPVTESELVDHCRARLASYKKPRRIVFVPELPKNPSGKVLKRELRPTLAGQITH